MTRRMTEDELGLGSSQNKKVKLSLDPSEREELVKVRDELINVKEELEKITRKNENLVNKLRDKVECPVCYVIPKTAPVPVCPNGHVVCEKCVREKCPTCRVKMGHGTSTLAVTVIENIEHQCDNDGCDLTFSLSELSSHMSRCGHRKVKCPGPHCSAWMPLSSFLDHVTTDCVGVAQISQCMEVPIETTYGISKDLEDFGGENYKLGWKLRGMKFEGKMFFLRVARKAQAKSWFFHVQMVGSLEDTEGYGVTFTVCRPEDGPEGRYSRRYSGDICPIDISTVKKAAKRGLCLILRDEEMAKLLVKNTNSGKNEFSVLVNIFRA